VVGAASRTPVTGPGPRIIVVGNHKGGSGKSTLAMNMIVALLKEGYRVASFDLDLTQQTLTHYIENREESARQRRVKLEVPSHCGIAAVGANGVPLSDEAKVQTFVQMLWVFQGSHDVIVIDTPGGDHHLSLLAHGMADILLTPINDSFMDLDAIMKIGPSKGFVPSSYTQAVATARQGRSSVSQQPIDWIVIRNRLLPASPNEPQPVAEVLEREAARIGYRTAPGLSERWVFRALFPIGLTAFDTLEEAHFGVRPDPVHLLGRLEVRRLMEAVGLVRSQAAQRAAAGRAELWPGEEPYDGRTRPLNDPRTGVGQEEMSGASRQVAEQFLSMVD
jgi:chromosome partitioning protein